MTNHDLSRSATDPDTIILPPGAEHVPGGAAAMPGWHIYADLTPPELMASRRVRSLRVWIAIALVLVVGGVAVAYDHARGQVNEAEEAVAAEQATGQALRQQQQQFSGVITLQGDIADMEQQTATLMASDVDVDALLGKLWAALPQGMTINQITVSVPSSVGGSGSGDTGSGAAALDASGDTHIGTVTLSGTGQSLSDVPGFIDNLSEVAGVFGPFPTSNIDTGTAVNYSLQLTLTDALLTHRFAVEGEN